MKPIISLIVAASENNVIGKNNQLLWYLPADLKYFKEQTVGKPVIMGRKTFDSIIEAIGKPLPNRQNIVITRKDDFLHENVLRAEDITQAIQLAGNVPEMMIIGGESIYEQVLPFTDKIYLTRVHHVFEGDVFFPILDDAEWQIVEEDKHSADDKNEYSYTFIVYKKLNLCYQK
jgi:dihydrofolate reductase